MYHAAGSFTYLVRLIPAVMLLLATVGSLSPSAVAAAGSQVWAKRYDGPGSYIDEATDLAMGPNGGKVFVTGYDFSDSTGYDYATVAYSASTGTMLWLKHYDGPYSRDQASAIAVSPDGSRVFVTGFSESSEGSSDWATIAYDGPTGAKLWVKRYNGPAVDGDDARAIGVSPDGATVFVAGRSSTLADVTDYWTIAYRASDGSRLWGRGYNGPGDSVDEAQSLAVSPNGSAVFVTGYSDGGTTTFTDYATVAYAAVDGAPLWTKRFNDPSDGEDLATAVGVSPDGTTVVVTGYTTAATQYYDYTTIAYTAATGTKIWRKSYNGPTDHLDEANAIAMSNDAVYVTGFSHGGTATDHDYATVAYRASDGRGLWTRRYNGPGNEQDHAAAIAVSPNGSAVFVTGRSYSSTTLDDYATVSYNASNGTTLWVKRYEGAGGDEAGDVAVSPSGSRIFVTGSSSRPASSSDYATVAYATA